eukprot:4076402-Pyramimonas_sp.AAC.1
MGAMHMGGTCPDPWIWRPRARSTDPESASACARVLQRPERARRQIASSSGLPGFVPDPGDPRTTIPDDEPVPGT